VPTSIGLIVFVAAIAAAIYGYRFAFKDAMNMYPRSKELADEERASDEDSR
jgi:hypothetical protein